MGDHEIPLGRWCSAFGKAEEGRVLGMTSEAQLSAAGEKTTTACRDVGGCDVGRYWAALAFPFISCGRTS